MKEPDLMSCMALVHSRIRRVVYWKEDLDAGCLGSRTEIHLIKSLNHHYEVYKFAAPDGGSTIRSTIELSNSGCSKNPEETMERKEE